VEWEILNQDGKKKIYKIHSHNLSASTIVLEIWLVFCALQAHPSDAIPFADLIYLPELFPFHFSISVDQLRQDERFDVQRQGGGLDMVGLALR
jgi:hypothetical protein